MRPLVLDASALVRLLIGPRPARLEAAVDQAPSVTGPELVCAEASSALWKYVRAGLLSSDEAARLLDRGLSLYHHLVPLCDLGAEALAEACRVQHPVYDLIYLVTARRACADLATCDRRLAALTRAAGIGVIEGDDSAT